MLFGIPSSKKPNLYILEIPWDNSSSFRRGCAEGPRAIREATSEELYNSFNEDLVNLAEHWSYKDLGDIRVDTFEELVEKVNTIVREHYNGELFLFLGGDHSITYATFKAIKEASGDDFGLIYFDAHPDMYPEYEGDKYSHACTVRRLIEEGQVKGGESCPNWREGTYKRAGRICKGAWSKNNLRIRDLSISKSPCVFRKSIPFV